MKSEPPRRAERDDNASSLVSCEANHPRHNAVRRSRFTALLGGLSEHSLECLHWNCPSCASKGCDMRRRDFLRTIAGAIAVWPRPCPIAAHAANTVTIGLVGSTGPTQWPI